VNGFTIVVSLVSIAFLDKNEDYMSMSKRTETALLRPEKLWTWFRKVAILLTVSYPLLLLK